MVLENLESMHNLLKNFAIPPQPESVLEIGKLLEKPAVDLNRIAAVISKDASLTAKVLKIANSPFFSGGRSIDSVGRALNVMGLNTFKTVVLKSALSEVFAQGDSASFETFWRHSELAALCCDIIAQRCVPKLAGSAYLAGMFHDCAIPVMQAKFDDYADLLKQSLHYCAKVIPLEESRYSTSHSTIGYFFAKSWKLPEAVCKAISHHHDETLTNLTDETEKTLVAMLMLSEYIIQDFDTSGNMKTIDSTLWMEIHCDVIDCLDIDADDIHDFEENLLKKANDFIIVG